MKRTSLPTNIQRQLWAQCGGHCQNPSCNKPLLVDIDDDKVSIANIAHIIGHGKKGPRSEAEILTAIEKDGLPNLIMLCLECHNIVDQLEKKFTVQTMRSWKLRHAGRIKALFSIPEFRNEKQLLREVHNLLEENKSIFLEYGPFSQKAIEEIFSDIKQIWRRRCLDTILPNNQRIINIITINKDNFTYPWSVYNVMLDYKIHADAFRDNMILDEKVDSYKLFPQSFPNFVKKKLGIPVEETQRMDQQEIEYRYSTIDKYINEYLSNHSSIKILEKWDRASFFVSLHDGRDLRIFVTNTYYFTGYTLDKIWAVNPNIDVIICSNPSSSYSDSAKSDCINRGIGLFTLPEFMGAVHVKGDDFLDYLLKNDRISRINRFKRRLESKRQLSTKCSIYIFGSYLRRKTFNDIDIIVVYKGKQSVSDIDKIKKEIESTFDEYANKLDFIICSQDEYSTMKLNYNNSQPVL